MQMSCLAHLLINFCIMKHLFIYLFMYSSFAVHSQEMIIDWDECFGATNYGSYSYAIESLPNGNIITSIVVNDNNPLLTNYHGESDPWVVLLNNNGEILIDRCFGGSNHESFEDIEIFDDFIYFIGYTTSSDGDVQSEPVGGAYDLWVVKTDSDLNIIWEQRYGSLGVQELHTAKVTEEGGLVLLMDFFVSGGGDVSEYYGNTDIWVCEINADGEILWEKTLGNAYGTFAGSVMQTQDGETIVLGEMDISGDMVECQGHNNNGTRDIWIVALDNTGEILWQNCYGGSAWEVGYDIIEDNEGYTFIGLTQSHDGDISFNHGNEEQSDLWLVHIDTTGNLLWEITLGGSDIDDGIQIYKTSNNGYLLFGSSESTDGDVNHVNCPYPNCSTNTWVIETDSNRNILWNRTYGPQGLDSYHKMNGVKRIGERGFIIAGIIHESENHTGDVDCEPYPIDSGQSAWIYRLYKPDTTDLSDLPYLNLKTYPNPANNHLLIDLPQHNDEIEIKIVDIFGNSIKHLTAIPNQTKVKWDCQNVAKGVYFYSSEIGGLYFNGKIFIQ